MKRKTRKKRSKKNRIINIISRLVGVISIVIAIIFCIYIYKLDMLPNKYLKILYISLLCVYVLLSLFAFPKHIKKKFKIFAIIIFILFSLVFGYGIKYADKTISFIDKINDELKQQEEYQIKVLSSNKISKDELNDKKIGVFKNSSYDKIIKKLNKKYNLDIIDYDDPIKLYEDLNDNKIDAIIASDNIYELLSTELSYMELSLTPVDSIYVPIDKKEDIVKIVDVTNTPFNIFIAGGDSYGGINNVMNTDVNMIVSMDVKNHKILLTSIPRDYYVILPGMGDNAYDKLTHAGYYGVEESVKAIEKLLDVEVNYYAKVNFSTIEKIVDSIGGIDIDNPFAFTSSDRVTHFNKGNIHLNGHQALMYARERQSFMDGDVQRVKNQQKIISAIIDKITSSKTLIGRYTDILDAISSTFATNLDTRSINRIVQMQLSDMRGWSLDSQNLVGYDSSSTNCYSIPNINLYVMQRDDDSVKNASQKIKEFLNK